MLGEWVDCPYEGYCRASTDALCVLTLDGRFACVNAAWEGVCGCPVDTLVGKRILDLVPDEERPVAESTLAELRCGQASTTDLRILGADQRVRWLRWMSARPLEDGRVLAAARDVTEVRATQDRMRRLNRALRTLSECTQRLVRASEEKALLDSICAATVELGGYRMAWVGLAEQDERRSVRPVAQAGYERGYLEGLDITWADTERGRGPTGTAIRTGRAVIARDILSDPSLAPWREQALARGYASSVALPLIANRETLGSLNLYATEPDAFDEEEMQLLNELADDLAYGIANFRLRHEHEKAQQKLVLADRMAALAVLSAGVAHDVNNPLATLMAAVDFLLEDLGKLSRELPSGRLDAAVAALRDSNEATRRIHAVVSDLGTLSRPSKPSARAVDVRQVLDSSIRMALHLIRHRARVSRQYAEVPPVHADDARLGQVFLNLLINAAHAIPEGDADGNEIRVVVEPAAEHRIAIEIRDTGRGIPPEVLARIFEPFFTTKPADVGTGLGLAISKGIVESYGGTIEVRSEPGRGSTFRVELVATSDAAAPARPTAPARATRRGRIAVIDDEWPVCVAIRRMLRDEHETALYTRGDLFLEELASGGSFDLVLLDVSMPRMSGVAVYQAVERAAPAMAERVVFMSGSGNLGETLKGRRLLAKPFARAELLELVASRLEVRPT